MLTPKEFFQMLWRFHTEPWKNWREPEFWMALVASIFIMTLLIFITK